MAVQYVLLALLAWLKVEVRGQTELTLAEKENILRFHNYLRTTVVPLASNMEIMLWSDELAAVAQAYAETCVFRHNPERSQQAGQLYAYVGENLAITSNPKKNYTDLINSWFQEREYYDFETNSCLPGQMCGHYTQIVWASTGHVGCGVHRCRSAVGFNYPNSLNFVCNYGPGGNYPGVQPYVRAEESCAHCPRRKPFCVSRLCTSDPLATFDGYSSLSIAAGDAEISGGFHRLAALWTVVVFCAVIAFNV
ncbi:hypothetical protein EMCRGX_G031790 [Ephydatia muelleri]